MIEKNNMCTKFLDNILRNKNETDNSDKENKIGMYNSKNKNKYSIYRHQTNNIVRYQEMKLISFNDLFNKE